MQDVRALAAGLAPEPRPSGALLARAAQPIVLDGEMRRLHQLQTRAAALLGMPRRTQVERLGQYGVPRPRK